MSKVNPSIPTYIRNYTFTALANAQRIDDVFLDHVFIASAAALFCMAQSEADANALAAAGIGGAFGGSGAPIGPFDGLVGMWIALSQVFNGFPANLAIFASGNE